MSEPKPEAPKPKTLDEAVEAFLLTKKHRSPDRQRKLNLQLHRMECFLKHLKALKKLGDTQVSDIERFLRLMPEKCKGLPEPRGLKEYEDLAVTEIEKADLEAYTASWDYSNTTMTTMRENMKSFWLYCYDSMFTVRNIAAKLPTIFDRRVKKQRKIPTLFKEEIESIIMTAKFDAITNVSCQTYAFTLVERYTGMAISDVTSLRLDALTLAEDGSGDLLVNRKKTGEEVRTVIPAFVVDALTAFRPDSQEYFFWSNSGQLNTRVKKWGQRLQALYAKSGVRTTQKLKRRRSGGVLKAQPELMAISAVTPHWWRHTFVRDCYIKGLTVVEIADLIGDDPKTVTAYYSSFDLLRQQELKDRVRSLFLGDPLTKKLS